MAPPAAADEWIGLHEDGFWPDEIQVDAGETLHFSGYGDQPWSVVGDNGLFDSGTLAPEGGFSMSLSVPGTHVYRTTAGPEHVARITVRPTTLEGGEDDPARPAIPDIAFPPVRSDDIRPHPDFGFEVSISRIMVGFREDATVGEANAALAEADVRIIGGLPSTGMLLVEPKAASDGEGGWWSRFYAFQEALEVLRASPGIAYAAMSAAVDGSAVPRRAEDAVAGQGWDWDDPFGAGNWGLAFAQFPEAWNLLEHIRRKQPQAITAVVDEGFEEHPDLPGLEVQSQTCLGGDCRPLEQRGSAHGNHVAGIIGAAFDNAAEGAPDRSRGVSGANPVARMYGYPAPVDAWTEKGLVDQHIELFDRILRSRPAELRVINYSMTPTVPDYGSWQDNYGHQSCGPGAADDDLPELQVPMKQICTPNNLDAWQREMAQAGRAAAPIVREAAQQGVMIVQAAGNDGVQLCPGGPPCQQIHAASRSPFAWVSHHWDDAGIGQDGLPDPVLVVQSLEGSGSKRIDSNLGGHIAAPGDAILSTVLGQGYDVMGGTSMAAPYVTGLIGYLLADDPSLTIDEVRRLVVGWGAGRPANGTGADFTWSMPDRTNRDATGDGLVDYRTDRSEIEPIRWDVDLDACDATVAGKPIGTYTWTVDSEVVGSTADCTFRWRPWNEGTYSVTLTATAVGGEQATVTKQVEVDDLLIVSVGDSIASGEGNPDKESPSSRWQLERCHRSAFGGPAQAARWLEAADARTSVTLLHLACSGGRIEGDRNAQGELEPGFAGIGGLLTPYEGVTEDSDDGACALSGRTDLSVCEPPQLDQAKAKVGDREIDALLVSIGANDMWFSSILTNCLIPLNDCSTNEAGRGLFEERIQLLPGRYARLAARIREQFPDLPSDRVVITQYPDLTTNQDGEVDLSCGVASGISAAEQQWAHETVIPALNAQVAQAAAAHGWTLAEGIPGSFVGHGYCSDDPWIVDITGTVWDQADKNGAFHPNYDGHSAYARAIIESVRHVLGLEHRQPRPLGDTAPRLNAFRAVAGNGPAARVADVNDPSEDGNRRVERTLAADGSVTETPDEKSSHVEGEHAAPDGRVDMRDLRRFRDAWLQRCLAESDGCPPAGEISLDGDETHPKRDLNFDGCVTDCGAREHRFSRFDFNGNRAIDTDARSLVPWKADGTPAQGRAEAERMSDVEVLQAAWTVGDGAEGWTKDDVPDLLRSADLEVHADAVLDAGAARAEVQVREKDGAPVGPKRTVRRRDGFAVLTVPLNSTSEEFELVTTASTDHGAMTSVSPPFSLKYGEDRLVAVCPDLSLKASPQRLPAGGGSTSVVTATVGKCHGREDVAGKPVSFELEPAGPGATVEALASETDGEGRAQAVFTPTDEGTYTVKVSVTVEDGADPMEAELEIEVVPQVTIRYVWRQTIEEWRESGTTRWQPFDPVMPDCTMPGFEYCIDDFEIGIESQQLGGVLRTGTLTGGGEQFELTETVANSSASSRATWSLSFPDGDAEDGGALNQWFVTDPDAYADHPVTGLRADDEAGGLRLRGLQAVGDLPYHYALFGQPTGGTVQPVEVPAAKNAYLLIPQGAHKIRFAAQPDEAVVFPRSDEGFGQFQSCGRLEEDLQTQKGYFVGGPSDYIPGAINVSRKTTYAPGDRPMPVGPGNLKIRYAFAATVAYEGEPVAEPVLPECTEQNPPQADFTFTPADGKVAKEGRQVAFEDRSSDPENDIVERTWDFGDGGTGSGTAPHHMFEDDGTYTVTLTVRDAEGNTDTATKEVEVANEPPEASIDDVTAGKDALRIAYRMLDPGHVDKQQLRFELTSSNPAFPAHRGTAHAGLWNIGPYTGLPPGAYPLTLKVTDKDGESDTDTAVAVVTEDPPPPPPPPPTGSFPTCDPTVTLDAEEREFLLLVNEYRDDNGLPPVGVSATLTRAADRHADDMAAEDFMEHTGSDGSSPADRAWDAGYPRTAGIGENLAESETADDALWAWRGSSTGHNENMLNPAWKAIGISRVKGSIWRWATSYGTVQDCPGATPAQQRTTRSFSATPTEGGVEPLEVEPEGAEPQVRRRALSSRLAADAAASHPPTPAIAFADAEPTGGKPAKFTNRSRDAAGNPIAARVRFGDTDEDPAFELPANGERTHVYPDSDWWEGYELRLEATDGDGRSRELSRWVDVEPVQPPYLYIRPSQQHAVAGRPYDVVVEASDRNTGDPIAGLELTFTVGGNSVEATTDPDGVARATVTLLDTEERQEIEVAFAGNADFKPETVTKGVDARRNHAPVAHAGGPYVTGEGGELMLDARRTTDEDPSPFDSIVVYEWDLDGDGAFDDLTGRLPRILEGAELDALVCGGPCQAGVEYPIALRVTDSHESSDTATTTVRFVADFDVLLGGQTKTIVPGSSNNFAVTVIGSRSYDKPVTLSAVGLPPGVTASFSKNPVTPTDVSVLTLTGSALLENGTYPLRISASDGTITKEITDELEVAFGLIPVCRGTIAGMVRDTTTGDPLGGATVSMPGGYAVTDASGRYVIDDVELGWQNAPQSHHLTANKDGYWAQSGSGVATCGAITRVDLELLDVRTGEVSGTVVDKETREPLPDATISEYRCSWSCWWQPVADADAAGRFEHAPTLGAQNSRTFWNGRADAPGYWYQQKGAIVGEGEPAIVEYELVEQCLARIVGGTVKYLGSNEPVAGAGVGVYLSGGTRADLTVQTRADGSFDVDRQVLLGHNNTAADYRVTVNPPADAPPGTQGITDSFTVAACAAQVSKTFYLYTPQPNYGAVEGVVTDEETGEPLADVWVNVGSTGARTDAEGRYRVERFHVGNDGQTQLWTTVATEPANYYRAAVSKLITAGQTAQADLLVLRKRHAALDVRVVDSVTGAPIPGARVSNGNCSGFSICIVTGREGDGTRSQLALGNRNAPVTQNFGATADGYWPQTKSVTLRADETSSVEYSLQPECEPARVTGRVVNAETQEPIAQAQVFGGGSWPVFTGADGRFVIEGIKPSTGNNPRQVTITASASGFYSQSKQITIFCGANIVVDFGSRNAKSGTIVGTVTDADTGEPLAGAFVGSDFGGTTTTGPDGRYRLEQVPLGDLDADREWSVVVHPDGYKARTKPVLVKAVGETPLDFAFSSANAPPVGNPRAVEVDEDQWVEFQLSGSDPDGDALTYHVMRWPEHGDLSGQRGRYVYEPDADYHGRDSLEFIVNDGVASSERVTVDLVVRPINDLPSALADEFEAQPDTEKRIPIATLLANDRDRDGDELRVVAVRANHAQATARIEGDEVVFMPPPGWANDTLYAFFDYTIEDAAGARSTAWVYIRVNHTPAAPVCADAAFAILRDVTLSESVRCTDVNGDDLAYAVADPPAQGTLALAQDGSFTYAPPAGFSGKVTFTYTASDGALESEPATVTIDVRASNAAPECTNVAAATDEDEPVEIALTCTDADGGVLAIEPRTQPQHGTLTAVGPGRYRYSPDKDRSGPDAFTFGAGDGIAESAPATATITVRSVNDPPIARDGTVELAEDDQDAAVDLAALVSDLETGAGDLALEIVDGPSKGRLGGTGAARTYTPDPDAHGRDSLTYRVRDRGDPDGCSPAGADCDEPLTDEGTVTFAIEPRNDLPACEDLTLAPRAGEAAEIEPACTDVDGDALTIAVVDQGAKGKTSVAGGRLRYVADADGDGEDAFTYRAADGTGASALATVAVTIRAATSQPPPASPPGDVKGDEPSGGDLLLDCARRAVVLEDVVRQGGRVNLLGVADRRLAGERAEIRFLATGKVVARPVVRPDGRFAATVKAPAPRLRGSSRARYQARIGDERSLALKLERRMLLSRVSAANGRVTISGRVSGPLAPRRRDRAIDVQLRLSCAKAKLVARVMPDRRGRFKVTLDAPEGVGAAVYRLQTKVRRSAASRKLFRTYTLPRAVDF